MWLVAFLFDECHSSTGSMLLRPTSTSYFYVMAFLRRHPWYVLFGALSAWATGLAIYHRSYHDAYFSITIKPVLLFYYFLLSLAGFYLLDAFLFRKKYVLYIVLLAVLITGSAALANIIAPINFLPVPGYSFLLHIIGMITVICTSTFARLLKERIQKKAEYNEYKARRAEAELALLKSQLNPHFLFNTLNSVYAQCLANREEAADMVLQLSDMLRYQLEADKHAAIPVEEEVAFIDNYIYFEKRRLPNGCQLQYTKKVDDGTLPVAPLMLITLVENCFKHGINPKAACHIKVLLSVTDRQILLETSNLLLKGEAKTSTRLGLQNLRRRLELLYPDRHLLTTGTSDGTYRARLQINL